MQFLLMVVDSKKLYYLKLCLKKWCGLHWPIARKNDLISLRSGALVAIFVYNFVHAYKCDNNLETA